MTIIAGAFHPGRDQNNTLESVADDLRTHLSRSSDGTISEYSDEHFFAIKFNIGAFAGSAFQIDKDAGSVALLAGHPLTVESGSKAALDRDDSLARISSDLQDGRRFFLEQSQGTFCAAFYDSANLNLSLVSDKLGLRLLYYWRTEEIVIFASALRILEKVSFVSKQLDMQGAFEAACFGFPLADRTPYAGIRCLEAGEVVRFPRGEESREKYWRWEDLARDSYSAEEIAAETSEAFSSAVRCRTSDDEDTVITLLSGGLDSRLINMELVRQGKQVHSYNFSYRKTQDQVIATQFAEALSLFHHESKVQIESFIHSITYLRNEIETFGFEGKPVPKRQNIVWSGDGGSVGMGFVYLSDSFLNEDDGRSLAAAASDFLQFNNIGFDAKLWTSSAQASFGLSALEILVSELERYEGVSRANRFYLFLLHNDQRRHLFGHLEDIDLIRTEMQLPFFDARLMELLFQLKVEEGIYHRFYHRLLEEFPPKITSVPWQTYPGHLPCPLPLPPDASYQWAKGTESWFSRAKAVLQFLRLFTANRFPRQMLNQNRILLAMVATMMGAGDYRYILNSASSIVRYWRKCDIE